MFLKCAVFVVLNYAVRGFLNHTNFHVFYTESYRFLDKACIDRFLSEFSQNVLLLRCT